MSYMGVDIGTTGCKAVVFDSRGRQLGRSYREYPLVCPGPDMAELDARIVMQECRSVIAESAAMAPGDPVEALSVSSQGESFTPVDADGRPLCNAMVSSDSRAVSHLSNLTERISSERLYRITGHTPHPMFSAFKLAWLRDERPDVWARATRFLCFEDLLHMRMGIEPHISFPLAGRTMLFDQTAGTWSRELLEITGLEEDRLARPVPSGQTVGALGARAAAAFGLKTGTRVVTGGHDQVVAALGAGVSAPGSAAYSLGTVECLCPVLDRAAFTDRMMRANLCTYRYVLPDTFASVAFSLTGGNLLRWFRDEWAASEAQRARQQGADPYEVILSDLPTEPGNLMVLPYFTPSGTPHFDTQTRAAILGMRLDTTRQDVLLGLLEGVAFEMRLNLDALEDSGVPVDGLIAVGGGSRSARLVQLKADVLGRPIRVNQQSEGGCLGAAILAMSARENTPARELAARVVSHGPQIEPDPRRHRHYTERVAAYRHAYPALRELDHVLRTGVERAAPVAHGRATGVTPASRPVAAAEPR